MTKVKTSESECKENENMHSFVKNEGSFHPEIKTTDKKLGCHGHLTDEYKESLKGEVVTDEKVIEIAKKIGLRNYKSMDPSAIAKELGIYELYLKN